MVFGGFSETMLFWIVSIWLKLSFGHSEMALRLLLCWTDLETALTDLSIGTTNGESQAYLLQKAILEQLDCSCYFVVFIIGSRSSSEGFTTNWEFWKLSDTDLSKSNVCCRMSFNFLLVSNLATFIVDFKLLCER